MQVNDVPLLMLGVTTDALDGDAAGFPVLSLWGLLQLSQTREVPSGE